MSISKEEFVEMYLRLNLSRVSGGIDPIDAGFEIKKVNTRHPVYSMEIPDDEQPIMDNGCGMNTIRVDIPLDKQIFFPNSIGFTLIFGYSTEHKMIVYDLR